MEINYNSAKANFAPDSGIASVNSEISVVLHEWAVAVAIALLMGIQKQRSERNVRKLLRHDDVKNLEENFHSRLAFSGDFSETNVN